MPLPSPGSNPEPRLRATTTVPHNSLRKNMPQSINLFRLLSEFIVFLLGALLILLAFSGRIELPTQPAGLIALGAFLVFWGVRVGVKPEPGLGLYESRVRSTSLALVGLSILSIPMLPGRLAPKMLGAAGLILVIRGLLGAISSIRRN